MSLDMQMKLIWIKNNFFGKTSKPYCLFCFTENHILEDVNKCVIALQECDADTLDRTAGAIRGRSARVCNVVTAEMDNFEPGRYTERVMEAVVMLRDQSEFPSVLLLFLQNSLKVSDVEIKSVNWKSS